MRKKASGSQFVMNHNAAIAHERYNNRTADLFPVGAAERRAAALSQNLNNVSHFKPPRTAFSGANTESTLE